MDLQPEIVRPNNLPAWNPQKGVYETANTTVLKYQTDPAGAAVELGYVVATVSLPRWLSCTFGQALSEHVDPNRKPHQDLNLYSHDWLEVLYFVSLEDWNSAGPDLTQKMRDFDSQFKILTPDHALSSGCSTASPMTFLRQLPVIGMQTATAPTALPDVTSPFYCIVTSWDKDPPDPGTFAKEITVVPQSGRVQFVESEAHVKALAYCYRLRNSVITRLRPKLTQDREAAFNAIKAFQGAP